MTHPMALSHPTALTIVLGFIALVMLIGVVLFAVMMYVIFKYRVPLRGIAAMAGALIYLVSPIDLLPEAFLGPIGLVDDAGVVGAATFFVYRLIQARKAAEAISGRPILRGPGTPVGPNRFSPNAGRNSSPSHWPQRAGGRTRRLSGWTRRRSGRF